MYFQSQDDGYCKLCVPFEKCESSVNAFGVLVLRLFSNFKKASEKPSEHFQTNSVKGNRFHQCAVQETATFECEALKIDNRLTTERAQCMIKIRSMIEAVIFCVDDRTLLLEVIVMRGHMVISKPILNLSYSGGDTVHMKTAYALNTTKQFRLNLSQTVGISSETKSLLNSGRLHFSPPLLQRRQQRRLLM